MCEHHGLVQRSDTINLRKMKPCVVVVGESGANAAVPPSAQRRALPPKGGTQRQIEGKLEDTAAVSPIAAPALSEAPAKNEKTSDVDANAVAGLVSRYNIRALNCTGAANRLKRTELREQGLGKLADICGVARPKNRDIRTATQEIKEAVGVVLRSIGKDIGAVDSFLFASDKMPPPPRLTSKRRR